jgi:hypothetical protein
VTVLYLPKSNEFDKESSDIPYDTVCYILKVDEIELKTDMGPKKKFPYISSQMNQD